MNSQSGPARILVVDDEPPIRRFLRTSLTSQGYQVLEADDGAQALDILKRNAVDVVVLDLGLPNLHGFEVIQRLRDGKSVVPIIVLSSRTDEAGKVKALDLGADDYVTKPFGLDELLARIDGLAQPFGMFVRIEPPIDFGAIDNQPVDLVFLLLTPTAGSGSHLSALAAISRRLREPAAAKAIRAAANAREIFDILTAASEK